MQNILLHICKIYVKYSFLAFEEKFFRNIDDSVLFVIRTQIEFFRLISFCSVQPVIFPILKRDVIEENHCLVQYSPFDVRNFISFLATPLYMYIVYFAGQVGVCKLW